MVFLTPPQTMLKYGKSSNIEKEAERKKQIFPFL